MSYMDIALTVGKKARGISNPNPPVGAVLVKNEQVIAEGFTGRPGSPHAEVMAITSAGDGAKGSVLYVTLEPCCHFGRTPPCTEAIIESGVSKVYIAIKDPDNRVSGKGIDRLQKAGIEVVLGHREKEAEVDLEAHIKLSETGVPLITAKFAVSLDGKIATSSGDSKWITSEESRTRAHFMRFESDAIMVGVNTVITDDPRLTVRLDDKKIERQPLRIVIDSSGRIPEKSALFLEKGATFVASTQDFKVPDNLQNVTTKAFPSKAARVDLTAVLKHLGSIPVSSVLVEGGSELMGSLFDEGLVDKVVAFISPSIIGGKSSLNAVGGRGANIMSEKYSLVDVSREFIGPDVLISGYCGKGD